MDPRRRSQRVWTTISNSVYLAMLALITCGNLLGPERWWVTSLNLYLPQWVWALPGGALLAVTAVVARRRVWMPLLGLAWVAWPLMGFTIHALWGARPPAGAPLRIMTYNVKWGRKNPAAIRTEVDTWRPDLLLLQDGAGTLPPAITLRYRGSMCLQADTPLWRQSTARFPTPPATTTICSVESW